MNSTQPTEVAWPQFLAQHNMQISDWPVRWQDAPHFGNALIGSMLYRVGDTIRLQVFRCDVQDHRDETYGWTAYSQPRLLIGHFSLHTVGEPDDCDWLVDLWNAELVGTIQTDKGEIHIRHFVHAEDMAIVTELQPTEGEAGFQWTWHPAPAQTSRPGYPTNDEEREAFAKRYGEHYKGMLKPATPNPEGRRDDRGEVGLWVQDLMAGGQYATAWCTGKEGDTHTHIATITHSYPEATAADTAASDIRRFAATDRASWIEAHRAWWHGYYPRSFVTIPDKSLEALYWHNIYRYGCTARAGRFHVDTSGLWFQGGPWPYTTNDWNTQASHWGIGTANRLEQGAEIVHRLGRHQDNLIKAVHPDEWQEDSAYLALATPADLSGSRIGDMRYYDCVGCLPWLMHNAYLHYRLCMDDDLLRDTVFPVLRRAINLYFHLAEEGEDGRIHLQPTYSPETSTHRDANFDLALFKWGCHTLLKACRRLDIDDPLIPRWKDVVHRLVDFPIDEEGFMLGAGQGAWNEHRHLSHLLMIYPLSLVNVEQGDEKYVMLRSYEVIGAGAGEDEETSTTLHAMVQTHAAPIAAVMGKGDEALDGLRRLEGELCTNGMWLCANNPCLEAALAPVNVIQEMLMQSWTDPANDEPGPIRIFPALPAEWQNVEFHDLRAEGAFLVSARREGGLTQWVRIKSLAGEPCRVRPGIEGEMDIDGDRTYTLIDEAAGVYEVPLAEGDTVTFSRK